MVGNNDELNMYKELIQHKRSGAINHCYGNLCDSFSFCPVCKDYEPCSVITQDTRKKESEEMKKQITSIKKELQKDDDSFLRKIKDKIKDVLE